ncbi:MAG: hypothetical protein V4578_01220 [Pseudomonadota bacterium]
MKAPSKLLADPNYDPNRLLDTVLATLDLRTDVALSRVLGVAPPQLSKVRHRRLPVPAELVILIHDATRLSIAEIRTLMGVPAP